MYRPGLKIAAVAALAGILLAYQNCAETTNIADYTQASTETPGDPALPPAITLAPESLTFMFMEPMAISIQATGVSLQYRWFKDDAQLTQFTGKTLSYPQALEELAGTYRVEVENPIGMDSRTFTVAVTRLPNQFPPSIVTAVAPLQSLHYNNGTSTSFWFQAKVADPANYNLAEFAVAAEGEGITYQWYFVNDQNQAVPIAGATQPTISFKLTSLAQIGAYRVSVKNAYGEVTSQAVLSTTATQPVLGAQYGGVGGMVAPAQTCPVGTFAIGLSMRAATYVDRVALMCGSPNLQNITAGMGGFSGVAVNLTCPAGRYLIGLNYATGNYVDRIQGVCGDKNGGNVTTTAFAGGPGGVLRVIRCPVGFAISELRGRAQNFVDALQVVCTFAY